MHQADQLIVQKSALEETHLRLGATIKVNEGWSVPASYGDQSGEYATIREGGAGLIDLSYRGRFMVTGSEAVSFLNGLITNDMKTLEADRWMPAALPNVQGRLVASVRVIRIQDDTTGANASPAFLIDTEPVTHEAVLNTLTRFTLAGDFRVTDVTGEICFLSLQGRAVGRIVREVLGNAVADVKRFEAKQVKWLNSRMIVIRASHTSEDGFDILVKAKDAADLWDALLKAGAQPVGFEALEVLRIEAGHPRYGIDMDETNVVSETNLDDAVSYTKGCYIGQEIIARIKYRGHVAKKLTGLMFERTEKVGAAAKVMTQEGREIGRITSMTYSPQLDRTIALAYVKYDYLTPGTQLKITSKEHESEAVVTQLPFVRGSWYEENLEIRI